MLPQSNEENMKQISGPMSQLGLLISNVNKRSFAESRNKVMTVRAKTYNFFFKMNLNKCNPKNMT